MVLNYSSRKTIILSAATVSIMLIGVLTSLTYRTRLIPSIESSDKDTLLSTHDLSVISGKQFNIVKYVVEDGDTVQKIAEKYTVSADSIRWANNLQTDDIQKGMILDIPPITGIIHQVAEGETISQIVQRYRKVQDEELELVIKEVIAVNVLDSRKNNDKDEVIIVPGQKIIIPGGNK